MRYPKWTILQIEDDYYLVLDKMYMKFISKRAMLSWGRTPVLSSKEAIAGYTYWKKVGFSPGSMIQSVVDNRRYVISGSSPVEATRHLIATPDYYTVLGFNPACAIVVSNEEVNFHTEGSDINVVIF